MLPPMNELNHILFDETKCIEFLFEKGIIFKEMKCATCRMTMNIIRKHWCCNKKNCRCSRSIFYQSVFADMRIKSNEAILIAYLWLAGDTHTTIMNKTKHSEHTITSLLATFRDLIKFDHHYQYEKIGGEGIIVEIDESKFGKRKYHRGHCVEGVWVFGGVERTEQHRMFAVPVPD